MRVAIAGGGLGGLAAALFLLRAGVRDVRVFEQQPSLGEIGAGIQVAPNAVRLLQRLGLGEALSDVAVPFEVAWEFRRWQDGRVLFSQTFGAEGEARFGAPYLAVHRADLLAVLAEAVPAGRRRAGPRGRRASTAIASCSPTARSSEPFDVLIGADGIHSVVRGGDRRPGLAASSRGWPPTARWCRPRRRRSSPAARSARSGSGRAGTSSTTRSAAGAQVNLVTANPAGDWREESWTAPGTVPDFLAEFAGWDAAVAAADRRRPRDPPLRLLRARADHVVGVRPGRAARRRRPPDAPVLRPGRGPGDRGRRGPRGLPARRLARRGPGRARALRVTARRARHPRAAHERRTPRAPPHARRPGTGRARRRRSSSQDPSAINEWLYGHDVEADL